MREEVVTHKVGNRSGMVQRRSGAVTQKPSRRESGGETGRSRLRSFLGYFPAVLKLVLAIVIGVLSFAGYRAAASASFFQVRTVEVQGASRASSAEIKALVRKDVEQGGVWNADLKGISTRLEGLSWVRTAVVSRVLPDGIRVRISERVPRAVARTASGRFRWIDEDAVLLGEMLPTDEIPAFFLRGLSEEDSAAAHKENRERVQKFIEVQRDWDAAGLSERVSEVNLIDIRDLRAQLAGSDSQIEVRLGSQDHGKRLRDALDVLDGQRQTPRGHLISYIDVSQGKRAIVGLVSGVHTTSDGTALSSMLTKSATQKKSTRDSTLSAARDRASVEDSKPAQNKATTRERLYKARETEKKSDKTKVAARRPQ